MKQLQRLLFVLILTYMYEHLYMPLACRHLHREFCIYITFVKTDVETQQAHLTEHLGQHRLNYNQKGQERKSSGSSSAELLSLLAPWG